MWLAIAKAILRYKVFILITLGILTGILGFTASKIQLSYELAKILPKSDDRFQLYESFKKKYGEDGAVMVIGLENKDLFQVKEFDAWKSLTNDIKKESGIKNVLSVANLPEVYIDSIQKKFQTRSIWDSNIATNQPRLDSLKIQLHRLPIYTNFLYTNDLTVHLMMITLDQNTINNKNRIQLVKKIKAMGESYAQKTGHAVHFSGMPFIRTEYTSQVTNELALFLLLAIAVTSII
ncbi:MAG: hypothetical protein RIS68_182, partial [Bacteroidota bacterium]